MRLISSSQLNSSHSDLIYLHLLSLVRNCQKFWIYFANLESSALEYYVWTNGMFHRVPIGSLWISKPCCGRGWTAIGNKYFVELRYALRYRSSRSVASRRIFGPAVLRLSVLHFALYRPRRWGNSVFRFEFDAQIWLASSGKGFMSSLNRGRFDQWRLKILIVRMLDFFVWWI